MLNYVIKAPTSLYIGSWFYNWRLQHLTHSGIVAPQNLIDIVSGNGLLPDRSKPLPEPMLTY